MLRGLPFRQAILTGLCVVAVTSCSNPQAGTDQPQDSAATSERSSANPPPVLVTQRSMPAASTSFPTGHPSLRPSTANNSVTSARASSNKRSPDGTNGGATALEDALPASGAAAPVSATPPADAAIKSDVGSTFDNLEVVDTSLKGKLAVLRVGSDPSTNNLLSVFAGLKNKTSRPLALEVQTIYKNKAGDALNAGSWVPLTLKPHEETEYRSSSISTEADDFLVRVRRAQTDGGSGGN